MEAPTRFSELLPDEVAVAEATGDMWESGLLPDECAHIRRAVPKRVREFTAGRNALRYVLNRLGAPAQAIAVGPARNPILPTGFVGTITHTGDYCAAAAARVGQIVGVGIDAELNTSVQDVPVTYVLTPAEQQMLAPLERQRSSVNWVKVLFSIKEAFYKAYFPIAKTYLDFLDAEVSLDVARSSFEIRILPSDPMSCFAGQRFSGRYRVDGDLTLAAIALSAAQLGHHCGAPRRASSL